MKGIIDMPVDIIEKVNAVTSADVQKLAGEIFITKHLNMALIGRSKDENLLKQKLFFK
jgi:predicted Zn-dependent peptidase